MPHIWILGDGFARKIRCGCFDRKAAISFFGAILHFPKAPITVYLYRIDFLPMRQRDFNWFFFAYPWTFKLTYFDVFSPHIPKLSTLHVTIFSVVRGVTYPTFRRCRPYIGPPLDHCFTSWMTSSGLRRAAGGSLSRRLANAMRSVSQHLAVSWWGVLLDTSHTMCCVVAVGAGASLVYFLFSCWLDVSRMLMTMLCSSAATSPHLLMCISVFVSNARWKFSDCEPTVGWFRRSWRKQRPIATQLHACLTKCVFCYLISFISSSALFFPFDSPCLLVGANWSVLWRVVKELGFCFVFSVPEQRPACVATNWFTENKD